MCEEEDKEKKKTDLATASWDFAPLYGIFLVGTLDHVRWKEEVEIIIHYLLHRVPLNHTRWKEEGMQFGERERERVINHDFFLENGNR
jgi:predicted metallopeptidase